MSKTLKSGKKAKRAGRLLCLALAAAFTASLAPEMAAADPPPWAPAHGYRAKHKNKKHKQSYEPTYTASVPTIDFGQCNRALIGGLIGAGSGAAIGSQFGKGDGNTAAIIGGTIIGALVGGAIGNAMDEADQYCTGQALEYASDGQTINWNNPNDGQQYQVTPVRTYQSSGGEYCREYTTTATVGGREQETYGIACRQPDGSWKLRS